MDSRKIAGGNESRRIAVKDSPGAPAYYTRLDHVAGRPYGVWVRGNDDTAAAASSVDKVATALSSTKAADVLEIVGSIDAKARQRAYELGGTLAATGDLTLIAISNHKSGSRLLHAPDTSVGRLIIR